MEAAGGEPRPAADRRTLVRRASYDLTGLPPTPEDVAAFEQDTSPDAYEKLVDRLLASPAHGEQWGRHWLDVVRYADTAGENSDHPLPHAWRYRNWVIGAFARDLPYDQFVREQIAGDLLARDGPTEQYADRVVATGYLAIARRFGHDIEKDVHLTLEDTLDTLGKSILGLSIGCCRCHDHKYDPLTDARLLRPVRHFRQHEVRLSRLRAATAAARPGAAGLAHRVPAARAGLGRKDSASHDRSRASPSSKPRKPHG